MKSETIREPRVGFLFPHPLTYSLGSTFRVLSLATGLERFGVDSSIIDPFEKNGTASGVRIINVPSIFSKLWLDEIAYRFARRISSNRSLSKFLIRNLKRTLSSSKVIPKIVQEHKLDILQIEQEPTAVSVLPILREISVPVVLDFHGVWAEELVDGMVIRRDSYEYSLLQSMVRRAVSSMDAILVMSEAMRKYVEKNYAASATKVNVIELSTQSRLREVPRKHPPPKVIYAGVLSKDKHAELFLDSIPYIAGKNPSTQFFITKKGDLIEKAEAIARTCGAKIKFFWFPTPERLFKLMSECHVGALTLPDNISYRLSPASKFYDYLAAGLPVVSNDIGGWTSAIEEHQVGILTQDDPREFSEGILRLINDSELAQQCGQRGLDLIREKYNADKICEKLHRLYVKLLREKNTRRA